MDPYGFEERPPPRVAPKSGEGRILAAIQILVLGLSALSCTACASWIMVFSEPNQPTDISILVWMLFSAPAWPLVGAVIATVFLRSAVQKWWAVAGPNVGVGAGGGCMLWLVVFGLIFSVSVVREMK